MGKADGVRHVFFGFIGGKTEHHALVSGADGFDLGVRHFMFLGFQRFVNAHGYVGGLFVKNYHNAAGVGVKAVFGFGIADFTHSIAHDFLDIHVCLCGDFSHYHNKAGGGAGFTGYTAHGILLHQRVKNRVRDGIAHFIGMAFSYGFRSK